MVTLKDMLDTIEHIARIRSITHPCGLLQSCEAALDALLAAIAKQIDAIAADLPAHIHRTATAQAQAAYSETRANRARDLAKGTGIPGTGG